MPGAINPVAVAIGPDDKIYLADSGDDTTGPRILVFADGDTEAEIIDFAATAGGHRTISVAPDGDIYVTDDSLVWRLPRS